MISIRNTALPTLSLLASLTLAACSGAPNESDVRAAVSKQMREQQNTQTAALGQSPFLDQQFAQQRKAVDSMKLIGCKSDSSKAYNCDIEVAGKAITARLVKGSSGWMIADQ